MKPMVWTMKMTIARMLVKLVDYLTLAWKEGGVLQLVSFHAVDLVTLGLLMTVVCLVNRLFKKKDMVLVKVFPYHCFILLTGLVNLDFHRDKAFLFSKVA